MKGDGLHPPALAEAITARGFSAAAGFRVVELTSGHAERALARRGDLVQVFGHFHGGVIAALADRAARPWAFRTTTLRSLDRPAEPQ